MGEGFTTANTVADAIEEVNDKLGDDVTTANTVSKQLADLSGTTASTSADTSVEGAKKYADEKIAQAVDGLDYTGVTTGTGVYVTNVTEENGVVSATTATLPTVGTITDPGKPITAVSESLGEVSATAGTINAEFVNVANTGFTGQTVEGVLAEIDAEYKAADVALKAEILGGASASADTLGELETIINSISAEAKEYSIVHVTTGLPETVKERYELHDAAGNVSGDTIDIPKDSHIVSINYITTGEHAQNLEYVYIDASGNTQTTYVDMSELVLETEFASGVTVTDHIVHGVVDPDSETFLTVGANGFKLSGVQDAIDAAVSGAVEDLDASESGSSDHVSVTVVEENGVITSVTVAEDDIASADDVEELSAKTVTEIASSNSSITVATAATTADDGTVSVDLVTDASKIQMSGFTAAQSGFTSITEASSVTDAFKAVEAFVLDNEEVVSAALNDLEETKAEITYVETVSGNLQTQIDSLQSGSTEALDNEIATRKAIEGQSGTTYSASTSSPYISGATDMTNADELLASALNNVETNMVSGATMNGSAVTKSNESLAFTAVAATGASNSANAIVIDTDEHGGLHFSLGTLDAGFYDSQA